MKIKRNYQLFIIIGESHQFPSTLPFNNVQSLLNQWFCIQLLSINSVDLSQETEVYFSGFKKPLWVVIGRF